MNESLKPFGAHQVPTIVVCVSLSNFIPNKKTLAKATYSKNTIKEFLSEMLNLHIEFDNKNVTVKVDFYTL